MQPPTFEMRRMKRDRIPPACCLQFALLPHAEFFTQGHQFLAKHAQAGFRFADAPVVVHHGVLVQHLIAGG